MIYTKPFLVLVAAITCAHSTAAWVLDQSWLTASSRFAQIEIDTTAEKMLLSQRSSGGWPKQVDEKAFNYENKWSPKFVSAVMAGMQLHDGTIDNNATSREIRYLVKAYQKTKNLKYLLTAETGIGYLLKMQYQCGGFPQYYPDTSGYRMHITYNDNAMINALRVLKDVAEGKPEFAVVNTDLKIRAGQAVEKAVVCILRTQIFVNGKRAVWCAQHDHVTHLPATARAYELPSLSGSESVEIVRFLMEVQTPSAEVKAAITGAIDWLGNAAISGFKTHRIRDQALPKGEDVVLVAEPGAKLWARFYDLESGKPFFCGRDGVKKAHLKDIENERRVGYAYYGTWPEKILAMQFSDWWKEKK